LGRADELLTAPANRKALSKRIGHADVAFTVKQYIQTGLEADRQVANTLAELGVSCVAFTSSVMLDTCGTQRRKTLIAWRRGWWC
jgi:hypothetical protein